MYFEDPWALDIVANPELKQNSNIFYERYSSPQLYILKQLGKFIGLQLFRLEFVSTGVATFLSLQNIDLNIWYTTTSSTIYVNKLIFTKS